MPKLTLPRSSRVMLVLAAALALGVSACASGGGSPSKTVTKTASGAAGGDAASSSSASPKKTAPPRTPVHIKLLNSDGVTYGVGMPVIAYFSRKITDGKPLQRKTTVSVNGKAAKGAWYFEYSSANKGFPIEGHFRLQDYWPAHSKIHIGIPTKGVSAGKGLAYDDSLTLDFATGARHIATVDDSAHTISVDSDGRHKFTMPVSLGASNTPTAKGTKVIMEKGRSICMSGPGYNECGVKDTQRLTYGGEYLHSAPWNIGNINRGVDSSNGCTNLRPNDAGALYGFLIVGDVVTYPNASGGQMQLGQGYGDWNYGWGEWQTGGLVSTT